jgi:hypothetical protein
MARLGGEDAPSSGEIIGVGNELGGAEVSGDTDTFNDGAQGGEALGVSVWTVAKSIASGLAQKGSGRGGKRTTCMCKAWWRSPQEPW